MPPCLPVSEGVGTIDHDRFWTMQVVRAEKRTFFGLHGRSASLRGSNPCQYNFAVFRGSEQGEP